MRRFIEAPLALFDDCERRYGGAVTLDLGSLGQVVLLSDPEWIKDVFRLPAEAFECKQYNEVYRQVMGGESLFLQDGEVHRRQRRLLAPPFRHDALLPKLSAVREIASEAIEAWPQGAPFNPLPLLLDVTSRVMVRLLFGDTDSETSRALTAAYRDSVVGHVGSWAPWRAFARIQPELRGLLARELEARRSTPDRPGLMTQLALARDAAGEPLSAVECQDHVFTLLVAGVDTSAISLSWALHWLSREGGALDRLVGELRAASTDDTGRALLSLPYLEAVFKETLRMYPIVPMATGRKLLREAAIGGSTFPAGVTVVPCTYLVHRREDLYPQSASFRPERFLDRRFNTHEYFPFGGGVRTCLGEVLARYEFSVTLATLLERRRLQASRAPVLLPVRHGTLLAPPEELEVVVQ